MLCFNKLTGESNTKNTFKKILFCGSIPLNTHKTHNALFLLSSHSTWNGLRVFIFAIYTYKSKFLLLENQPQIFKILHYDLNLPKLILQQVAEISLYE